MCLGNVFNLFSYCNFVFINFKVLFEQHYNTGKISKQQAKNEQDVPQGFARVQCFPFYTLVAALNVTTIDYFSLDVEGSELDVLHTIPFDSVFIKVKFVIHAL